MAFRPAHLEGRRRRVGDVVDGRRLRHVLDSVARRLRRRERRGQRAVADRKFQVALRVVRRRVARAASQPKLRDVVRRVHLDGVVIGYRRRTRWLQLFWSGLERRCNWRDQRPPTLPYRLCLQQLRVNVIPPTGSAARRRAALDGGGDPSFTDSSPAFAAAPFRSSNSSSSSRRSRSRRPLFSFLPHTSVYTRHKRASGPAFNYSRPWFPLIGNHRHGRASQLGRR